jgi:hypothetical protein
MSEEDKEHSTWFGAKCIFHFDELDTFEERIIILRASSLDNAIELAEQEACAYESKDDRCSYTGFVNVYKMYDEELKEGAEVYSIMRKSKLSDDEFLDKYYDDGSECTKHYEDD